VPDESYWEVVGCCAGMLGKLYGYWRGREEVCTADIWNYLGIWLFG
jgi:hypothetical protein